MLYVWVNGCDPGRVIGCLALALYPTRDLLSSALLFFFWHVLCVIVPFFVLIFLFLFCFVFILSLVGAFSVDVPLIFFLSSRPRSTGLATTYITAYG